LVVRRNVLLIAADQWRADCLGAAGNAAIRTPVMDRFAADATLFKRHYSAVTPCGPSRVSMLTGMYAHNHRSIRNGTPLADHFTNVAREFRRAGYDPMLFGYTDAAADPTVVPPGSPELKTYEGLLSGFSVGQLLGNDPVDWLTYLEDVGYKLPGPGQSIFQPSDEDRLAAEGRPRAVPARFAAEHSDTAWLVRRCIEHLRGHARNPANGPFFVHLAIPKPHPPLIAPAPYHQAYRPEDLPRPIPGGEPHPLVAHHNAIEKASSHYPYGVGLAADLTEEEVMQLRATYYGLVEEMDTQLGVLFDALVDLNLWDETLILLTSDHGEQLGDHGMMGKLGFYDQSQQVPLIIRDPFLDDARGRAIDAFTQSVDLVPTMLDWAELDVPNGVDGRSLESFLCGQQPPQDWRTSVHWTYDFRDVVSRAAEDRFHLTPEQCTCSVLRSDRYKYVHFPTLPLLLFDLDRDPQETRNLAEDSEYRDVRLQCAEQMLTFFSTHRDETLALTKLGPQIVTHLRHERA
jgi:arylsulfatase A-like enzyme